MLLSTLGDKRAHRAPLQKVKRLFGAVIEEAEEEYLGSSFDFKKNLLLGFTSAIAIFLFPAQDKLNDLPAPNPEVPVSYHTKIIHTNTTVAGNNMIQLKLDLKHDQSSIIGIDYVKSPAITVVFQDTLQKQNHLVVKITRRPGTSQIIIDLK